MNSNELITTAMRSQYPVSEAIGILERESENTPDLKELIRAVFMVYLIDKYPKMRLCLPVEGRRNREPYRQDRNPNSIA